MPFYTPNDLTNSSYVANMGPQAKDSALAWSQQALDLQQSKLTAAQTQAEAATAALAQAPTRQQVNAAKAAAADPALTAEQRAAAAAQATALENQRIDALDAKAQAEVKLATQEQVVAETTVGISNLQQAGAVPNPSVQASTSATGEPIAKAVPAEVLDQSNPTNTNTGPNTGGGGAATTTTLPSTQKPGEDQMAQTAAQTDPTYIKSQKPGEDQMAQNAATASLAAPPKSQKPGEDQMAQTAATSNIANEQKPVDEFDGIDAQIAERQTLADEAAMRDDARQFQNSVPGLTAAKLNTASQATQQDANNFKAREDWRVRLSLAPGANYLYAANPAGILAPLSATNGIIFPYTPSISVNYAATYDPTELTHSNYKFFTYKGSAVDSITLGCDFTAQDVFEANYLLAVIHFFRSITKMFYGQDTGPGPGTPPPLCYLSGLGAFQFDTHPLAITGFTYNLPTDVDYIRAGSTATPAGVNRESAVPKSTNQGKPGETRMAMAGIQPGALTAPPNFSGIYFNITEPTYVPTKINLSITAVPIVTRNDISNNFSLKQYATGALLRGTTRQGAGGGIW